MKPKHTLVTITSFCILAHLFLADSSAWANGLNPGQKKDIRLLVQSTVQYIAAKKKAIKTRTPAGPRIFFSAQTHPNRARSFQKYFANRSADKNGFHWLHLGFLHYPQKSRKAAFQTASKHSGHYLTPVGGRIQSIGMQSDKIPSGKKMYRIQSRYSMNIGALKLATMPEIMSQLLLPYNTTEQSQIDRTKKKNTMLSCGQQRADALPRSFRFLQKYFAIKCSQKYSDQWQNIYLAYHLRNALYKKDFPVSWEKSAYTLKNLSYKFVIRDRDTGSVYTLYYNNKARSWHWSSKTRAKQKKTKSGNFSKRFWISASMNLNLYGLKVQVRNITLHLYYTKRGTREYVYVKWYGRPNVHTSGRIAKVLPLSVADIFVPGNAKSMIEDYVSGLIGKYSPKRKYFLQGKVYPGSQGHFLYQLSMNYDYIVNPLGTFLANRSKSSKRPMGKFFQTFWNHIQQDLQ